MSKRAAEEHDLGDQHSQCKLKAKVDTFETNTIMVILVYTGGDTQLIVGDIPASANLPLDPDEEPPSFFTGTLEANYPELHAFLLPAWADRSSTLQSAVKGHPGEIKCDGSEADRLLLRLQPSVCVRVWANYVQAPQFYLT